MDFTKKFLMILHKKRRDCEAIGIETITAPINSSESYKK